MATVEREWQARNHRTVIGPNDEALVRSSCGEGVRSMGGHEAGRRNVWDEAACVQLLQFVLSLLVSRLRSAGDWKHFNPEIRCAGGRSEWLGEVMIVICDL